jgi:hypothetical protein
MHNPIFEDTLQKYFDEMAKWSDQNNLGVLKQSLRFLLGVMAMTVFREFLIAFNFFLNPPLLPVSNTSVQPQWICMCAITSRYISD